MNSQILVVEDDHRMSDIVKDYLEMAGYKVFTAYDGVEAMASFEKEHIDLVILDIMIPKLDGWSVCRRIRQKSNCLIVILSARSEEEDRLLGFELGADEYVTKPFSPKVLTAAITALLRRDLIRENNRENKQERYICQGSVLIDRDNYSVCIDGKLIELTSKEFDLLVLLMNNPGKVFKRNILIESIWNYNYYGDGRVVDTNIKTLRKKLGNEARFIQTVIGIGYKFEVKL